MQNKSNPHQTTLAQTVESLGTLATATDNDYLLIYSRSTLRWYKITLSDLSDLLGTPQASEQWEVVSDVANQTGGMTEINVGSTWTGAGLHAFTRVASGAAVNVYFYADNDYTIDTVTKNGTDVTASLTLVSAGTWKLTLGSVSGNQQIVVAFKSSSGGGTPATQYIVEASAYPVGMGTIEIKAGGVWRGARSYDRLSLTAGTVVEIFATPYDGYMALRWTVNGTTQPMPEEGGVYSVASLAGDITIEARFRSK